MARNPIGILAPQFAQGALSAAAARGQQTAAENARIAAQRAEIAARERIAAQQAFIDMQRVRLGYAEMEARNRLADQQNKLEEKRLSQQERLALNAEKNTTERFLANLEEQKTSRISSEAIAKAQLGLQRGQFDIMAAKERRLYRALEARKKLLEVVREKGPDSDEAKKAELEYAMYDENGFRQAYNKYVAYPDSARSELTEGDIGSMKMAMFLTKGDEQAARRIADRDTELKQNFVSALAAVQLLSQDGIAADPTTLDKYRAKLAESYAAYNMRRQQLGFDPIDMQGNPIDKNASKKSGGVEPGLTEADKKRYETNAAPATIPYVPSTSDPNEGAFWRSVSSDYGSVPAVPTGISKVNSPWAATALVPDFTMALPAAQFSLMSTNPAQPNLNITPADAPGRMVNMSTNPARVSSTINNIASPASPVIQFNPETGQIRKFQ